MDTSQLITRGVLEIPSTKSEVEQCAPGQPGRHQKLVNQREGPVLGPSAPLIRPPARNPASFQLNNHKETHQLTKGRAGNFTAPVST